MPQPIKVVHLVYSGQSGLGSFLVNLVNSDKHQRFQHAVFFYGRENLYSDYQSYCLNHHIEFTFFKKKRKFEPEAFSKCRSFIQLQKAQFVILHTFSLTPFYWLKRFQAKVVSIDHTAMSFKTKLELVYSIVNHIFAYKSIYFHQSQFNQLKRRLPLLVRGRNTSLMSKSVDSTVFTPKEKGKTDQFVLGISSRLVGGKRHDLIIRAIHSLLSMGVQVQLRVAGSGTELQRLEELVKELNLAQQIEFLGQIDVEELLPFYHSLDAYIHASNGETQCYSILEAQACGLPILASNVVGIKEFIRDQEEGLLFANNVSSISNSIQTLMKDSPLRRHLAQQSRKLALRESTNNNLAEQLYRILSE